MIASSRSGRGGNGCRPVSRLDAGLDPLPDPRLPKSGDGQGQTASRRRCHMGTHHTATTPPLHLFKDLSVIVLSNSGPTSPTKRRESSCPDLRKLSSKALLYRCAASRAAMLRGGWLPCTTEGSLEQQMCWSGPIWWAREELNLRPLPCQQNTGNRCAGGRFPRSRSTVGAEVKCSHSVQLNALLTRSRLH